MYVILPITTASSGENWYFLNFTNDYSGKTWVYLLKEKKEVFSKFKKFKNWLRHKMVIN